MHNLELFMHIGGVCCRKFVNHFVHLEYVPVLPLWDLPLCQRSCRLCDHGEVEDQTHFLIICPAFNQFRLQLFNQCNSLSCTFFQQPITSKLHFILSSYDHSIANILTEMYTHRQSLLFSNKNPHSMYV